MEDPEDLMVIDTVKNITQLKPEVVLAGQSVINKCIDNYMVKVNKSSPNSRCNLKYQCRG